MAAIDHCCCLKFSGYLWIINIMNRLHRFKCKSTGICLALLDSALADLRGGARDAPPGVQILSFSCSFWQKFEK